jgi:hypothetical protein
LPIARNILVLQILEVQRSFLCHLPAAFGVILALTIFSLALSLICLLALVDQPLARFLFLRTELCAAQVDPGLRAAAIGVVAEEPCRCIVGKQYFIRPSLVVAPLHLAAVPLPIGLNIFRGQDETPLLSGLTKCSQGII